MRILFAFLIGTLYFCNYLLAEAAACPLHAENSEQSEDYLEASEQEVEILGKKTFHANIAMIEKALKEKGVSLPENGYITSDFRKALIAFQESAGLPAKGEINQETLDKLGVKF